MKAMKASRVFVSTDVLANARSVSIISLRLVCSGLFCALAAAAKQNDIDIKSIEHLCIAVP
jgi:hypothetical protein